MKLALIGSGKMGAALLEGALGAGVLEPRDITVVEIREVRRQEIGERYGVRAVASAENLDAGAVVLSVKPQDFLAVAPVLRGHDRLIFSIMAGVPLQQLSRELGTDRVVRAMPTLGAVVARSQTALAWGSQVTDADKAFVKRLAGSVGQVYELGEYLFDAYTALVGSGPAYLAVIADALADAAVREGFSRELAMELAARLFVATGELLSSGRHPAILRDEVASPAGTSIEAVYELEKGGVRAALLDAIRGATRRSKELGEKK